MKYCLFYIDAYNEDFDYNDDYDYDLVEKCAFNRVYSDDLASMLIQLVSDINNGNISDENFYIVGNTEERSILMNYE